MDAYAEIDCEAQRRRRRPREPDRLCPSCPRSRSSGVGSTARWSAARSRPSRSCTRGRSRRHVAGAADLAARLAGRPSRRRAGAASTSGCRSTAGDALRRPPRHERPAARRSAGRAGRDAPAGAARASPTAALSCASSTSARSAAWRSSRTPATACRRRVAHIARDPLDPDFDLDAVVARAAAAADRAQAGAARPDAGQRASATSTPTRPCGGPGCTGPGRPTSSRRPTRPRCSRPRARSCARRSGQGGTSFDALYVNVNGESGYFDRSLARVRPGGPAVRALRHADRREAFMNRSSFRCPRCQRTPRRPRW